MATSRIENDRWWNTKHKHVLLDIAKENVIEKLQYQHGEKAEGLT